MKLSGTELDRKLIRNTLRRIKRARRFPYNTDPCSRHVEIMAECLATYGRYMMFEEEPLHCAISLLLVIESLYKTRNQLPTPEPPHD